MGIKSIWGNKFYDTPPLPKWSFEVIFNDIFNSEKNKEKYGNTLNSAVTNIQIGRREISLVKTYYCGIESNFPGRAINAGELNITFNENSNLEVSKILEELFAAECNTDKYYTNNAGYNGNSNFSKIGKTLTVKILKPQLNMVTENDKEGAVIRSYHFHNCFLTSIQEEEMNYNSSDEVLTKSARISYDYMTRD